MYTKASIVKEANLRALNRKTRRRDWGKKQGLRQDVHTFESTDNSLSLLLAILFPYLLQHFPLFFIRLFSSLQKTFSVLAS